MRRLPPPLPFPRRVLPPTKNSFASYSSIGHMESVMVIAAVSTTRSTAGDEDLIALNADV